MLEPEVKLNKVCYRERFCTRCGKPACVITHAVVDDTRPLWSAYHVGDAERVELSLKVLSSTKVTTDNVLVLSN